MTATFRTSQGAVLADPKRPHIILVGLPGAGKSTVGAAAAVRLGRGFLDFDREIERREGASISTIFGERGEHYFRTRERDLTSELVMFGNMILAPGGGWITQPDVVAILRPPARMIYLRARPATLLRRLGADIASRPLLSRADPLTELGNLLAEREPLYRTADHEINTEMMSMEAITDRVVELASSESGGYVTK